MPKRSRDPFDEELRRERVRLLLNWVAGIALVGAVLGGTAYLAVPGEVHIVDGTVLAVHAVSHEEGHSRYVDLELAGGRRVKARLPDGLPIRIGASVEAVRTEALFSSTVRYHVRGYIE